MERAILLTVLFIGLINANIFGGLFSSSVEDAGGISIKLSAANPLKYNHTTGAGANYVDVKDPNIDGFYFACGERAAVFIDISTDGNYAGTLSTVWTLKLNLNAGLSAVSVLNNCGVSGTDAAAVCISGGSVQVSLTATGEVQFTKLGKSSLLCFFCF
jgi:hypothetical protein